MYTRIRVTMAPLRWTHCENLPRQIAFFKGSFARSLVRSFVGSTTDNSELPICAALSLLDTSQQFFTHYERRTVFISMPVIWSRYLTIEAELLNLINIKFYLLRKN